MRHLELILPITIAPSLKSKTTIWLPFLQQSLTKNAQKYFDPFVFVTMAISKIHLIYIYCVPVYLPDNSKGKPQFIVHHSEYSNHFSYGFCLLDFDRHDDEIGWRSDVLNSLEPANWLQVRC